jgi:predicted RNA binding protein YcfA (HicA-like mRNA interferase family)
MQRGSHWKWHNPASGEIRPFPGWGKKDLKMGTLRHFIRQLGLDWDELVGA